MAAQYRTAHGLGLATMILLGLCAAVQGGMILASASALDLLYRDLDGEFISEREIQGVEDFVLAIQGAWLLIFITTAVIFLIWLYRSYENLKALRITGTEFSSTSAVVWWFVPVAFWVQPFRAVKQLWQASVGEVPWYLWAWWAAWVSQSIVFSISGGDESLESTSTAIDLLWISIVGSLISITAAILAIVIVKAITEAQEARWHTISSEQGTPHPVGY